MLTYLPGNRYLILERRFFSSSVFLVRDVCDHKIYFAKQVSASSPELTAFRFLKHPMLPALHEIIPAETCSFLILQYLSGPNLEESVLKYGPLSQEIILSYASNAASLIHYLHTQDPVCIHGDLKPSNLMLHSDHNLYLVDFGSCSLPPFEDSISGTPYFAAPEQKQGQLTAKCDIYSFGKTFLALSGPDLDPSYRQLFTQCCSSDPRNRPEDFSVLYHLLTS